MAQASLRASEAEVRKFRMEREEARRSLDRVEALGSLMSEEDRAGAILREKRAISAVEVAEAHAEQQSSLVKQIEERLSETSIRAPFEGSVAARYQDQGSMVRPGIPILRLIGSGDLLVRFAVPEDEVASLRTIATLRVAIPALGIEIPATIEKIAPEIDAASQMVVAEARLAIPPDLREKVQSGAVARVSAAPSGE